MQNSAGKSLQSCLTLQPHRWQPTRLPRPWDSPGKNTGVGCHFLLQCMKVKSESEVSQLCPTPSDPMDCSLPGSSIHGIFQARVPEWGAIAFKQIASANLLSGTESSIWCSVITQGDAMPGREAQEEGDVCMQITGALHCTAQTNKHCNAIIV